MAGVRATYGLDCCPTACASYRANFPNCRLFEATAFDFVQGDQDERFLADILHLSPPCQYFSPAHTVPGQNDDMKSAAIFSCGALLDRVRPRLFTLEQTFGMSAVQNHKPFFNALVADFTSRGFSVRWRVISLPELGLPQKRQRLIMIGACPGEALPPFPDATHGLPGLPAYVPVRKALQPLTRVSGRSRVRLRDRLHMPDTRRLARPMPPYSPDTILGRCITTSGGGNYHPSGVRDFTPREYSLLQGFPRFHRFQGQSTGSILRQIGNTFPPCVVQTLYAHLERCPLRADGVATEVRRAHAVIDLEDNFRTTVDIDLT